MIQVYGTNSSLAATVAGTSDPGRFSSVQRMHIRTMGGNDQIQFDANVTVPAVIYGRGATDRIIITGTTNSDTFGVNDNSVSLNGSNLISFSGIHSIALTAGGSPAIDGGEGVGQIPGPDPVDTFNVTQPLLSDAPMPVISVAGSGNDILNLTTAANTGQTVSVSNTQVLVANTAGTTTVTFSGVPTLNVTAAAGDTGDTFNVTESASGNLLPSVHLTASGGSSLVIDDTASSSGQAIGIDATKVSVGSGVINYTSFNGITVNTSSTSKVFTVTEPANSTLPTLTLGAVGGSNSLTINDMATTTTAEVIGIESDKVTIRATPTSTPTSSINYTSYANFSTITVNTRSNNDAFTVTEPATGIVPTLTLGAGGGTSSLTIDDTASTANQTVVIGYGSLAIGASPTSNIFYASFHSITVNTGSGNDAFTVYAGTVPPTLTLGAGDGTNSLTIVDTASTANQTVGINSSAVTIGTSTINYTSFNGITVNTGIGDDTFTITQASAALLLPASITVNADGGYDTLNVIDNTAGQPVTIDNGKVMLDSLNTFNYSSVENLNVTTANAQVTINESTSTTLPPSIGIHDSTSFTPLVTVNTGTENDLVTVVGSQITLGRNGVIATSIINVFTIPTKAINLYINTKAGSDTVTVTISPAINGCFLDGGDGSDTFALHDIPVNHIGRDGTFVYSSVASDLACLITAVATSNIEHIALDQGDQTPPFSISRSNATGISSVPVNWSLTGSALTGLASVDLALDGTQAIKIPLQTLNGPDTFTYHASAAGAGSSTLATIDVTGSATNSVTILGTPGNDVFDINGNTVSVNGGPRISFTGVGTVSFQGDGGDDTFTVTEPTNTTLPTLNINAGTGTYTDTLTIIDTAANTTQAIGIDSTKVTIGANSTINYTGLDNITVSTDGGNDTFTVTEPVNSILPTLNITANTGTDALILDDTAAGAAPQVVGINSTTVTIGPPLTPITTINYTGLDNITVSTDGGNDTFTVTEPGAGTLPTLNLDAGSGASTDALIVNDTAAGVSPQAVGIGNSSITIGATPTSTINYTSLENITVNTGGADDVFTITQASTALLLPHSITVNADGGYDTLNVVDNTAGQPVTIDNGKVMLDSLNTFIYSSVENLNVTTANRLITINESTRTTLPPSIGINDSYTYTSVVTVNTGTEDDLVTVVGAQITRGRSNVSATSIISVTAHATDLYINTNAGNDTVTLTISPVLNSCWPNGGDGSDTFVLHDQHGRDGSFSYNNANSDLACAITAVATTYMEHIALDQGGLVVPFSISHIGAPVPWSLTGSALTGLPSVDLTLDGTQVFSLALSGSDTFTYNGSAPGIGSASLATINVTGNSTNSVTIAGTAGDDVFEINGNTVSVNGGPLISFAGVGAVSFQSDGGNDTFHVRARPTMSTNFVGSDGSLDTVDFSGVNMSSVTTLPSMTGIEILNLSHASLSTVPTLPSGITALDLRYNNLNLSNSTSLTPLRVVNEPGYVLSP